MKNFAWLERWLCLGLSLSIIILVIACSPDRTAMAASLNSRYSDEQPAISGNGRYLAFVSNRSGNHQLFLYDLQQQTSIPVPRLNRPGAIAESPSLSYTARYIVCIISNNEIPELVLYDRITQNTQVLSRRYQGWIRHPNISPDGRYIVFESSIRGQWDIEVFDRGSRVELDLPDGALINSTSAPD